MASICLLQAILLFSLTFWLWSWRASKCLMLSTNRVSHPLKWISRRSICKNSTNQSLKRPITSLQRNTALNTVAKSLNNLSRPLNNGSGTTLPRSSKKFYSLFRGTWWSGSRGLPLNRFMNKNAGEDLKHFWSFLGWLHSIIWGSLVLFWRWWSLGPLRLSWCIRL